MAESGPRSRCSASETVMNDMPQHYMCTKESLGEKDEASEMNGQAISVVGHTEYDLDLRADWAGTGLAEEAPGVRWLNMKFANLKSIHISANKNLNTCYTNRLVRDLEAPRLELLPTKVPASNSPTPGRIVSPSRYELTPTNAMAFDSFVFAANSSPIS